MLVASLAETWRFLRILDSCCSRKRKEKAGLQMPESACFAELQLLPDLSEERGSRLQLRLSGLKALFSFLLGFVGLCKAHQMLYSSFGLAYQI